VNGAFEELINNKDKHIKILVQPDGSEQSWATQLLVLLAATIQFSFYVWGLGQHGIV
jgi:hypothetical protein